MSRPCVQDQLSVDSTNGITPIGIQICMSNLHGLRLTIDITVQLTRYLVLVMTPAVFERWRVTRVRGRNHRYITSTFTHMYIKYILLPSTLTVIC